MLATCWAVFGTGNRFEFPTENEHYFVYWILPWISAIFASLTYAIYNGDKIFGHTIFIGPLKGGKAKKD
jgi:hypothetical protein